MKKTGLSPAYHLLKGVGGVLREKEPKVASQDSSNARVPLGCTGAGRGGVRVLLSEILVHGTAWLKVVTYLRSQRRLLLPRLNFEGNGLPSCSWTLQDPARGLVPIAYLSPNHLQSRCLSALGSLPNVFQVFLPSTLLGWGSWNPQG